MALVFALQFQSAESRLHKGYGFGAQDSYPHNRNRSNLLPREENGVFFDLTLHLPGELSVHRHTTGYGLREDFLNQTYNQNCVGDECNRCNGVDCNDA